MLDGAGVARGVELLASWLGVVLRDEDDDAASAGCDELLEDELDSTGRLESLGELRSHCDLPLVAVFGGSWQ